MDFEDLVNTPRKIRMLSISVAFLLAFPIYFQIMPSLIDDEMMLIDEMMLRRWGDNT